MRALTVAPGTVDSTTLEDYDEPSPEAGAVLVQTHAVGICGTDSEIVQGLYGWAPPGRARLVLGHESIGRVLEAPADSNLSAGDWVVAIVRRADPVPCRSCAAGEWDMCQNGQYTEHGIKSLDGFARERYRIGAESLVRVDARLGALGVLLEPTSIVAKAWEHCERIGQRAAAWRPRRVLVTGAGPIGLLTALLGVQRGFEVHVLDRVTDGPKPALVRALGATYHSESVRAAGDDWDLVFECTGAAPIFFDVIEAAAANGIVCLTGVSSGGGQVSVDPGALNRELVLENNVVFGSVNANRRHYEQAAEALAKAELDWLSRVITRSVPIERWREAFERKPGDVKTVLTFT
jgi:threonine dehydrogenase-like Zn-dependent dehydrogenase